MDATVTHGRPKTVVDVVLLEAGCGAGAFLEAIHAAWPQPQLRLHAFDSSAAMVDVAKRRLPFVESLRVASLQAPLPYPSGAFDVTFCMSVFQYLDSLEVAGRAYRELLRVTKPGGSVTVGIIPHPQRRAEEASVRGGSHSNADKASAVAAPEHLRVPQMAFSKACVAAAGKAHYMPLWKSEEFLELGIKQASYWYSHVCHLGAAAASAGASRRPQLAERKHYLKAGGEPRAAAVGLGKKKAWQAASAAAAQAGLALRNRTRSRHHRAQHSKHP